MARTNWKLTEWLARDVVEVYPHAEEIGNYFDVTFSRFERLPDFQQIVAHTKEFVENQKEHATTSQIENGIFDDLDEIDWAEQAYQVWDMYWSDRMEMGFFDPITGEWVVDPETSEPIAKAEKSVKYGEKVLLKTYKNGNKLWGTVTRCAKCNGSGKVIWTYADHVCFDCNGKGWYYYEEREYTPENLAKLEAKREAERVKAEEKAKLEAERAAKIEAERLAEIERNRGSFIGKVGDKINIDVTLIRRFSYEITNYACPWKTDVVTGYVFKTDDGNTLVWKTTSGLYRKVYKENGHFMDDEEHGRYDYESPEDGDRVTIRGTIKDHEEFENVNQTILKLVKWIA